MVCEFGPIYKVLTCYGVIGYFLFIYLFDSSLCSLFWNFTFWLFLFWNLLILQLVFGGWIGKGMWRLSKIEGKETLKQDWWGHFFLFFHYLKLNCVFMLFHNREVWRSWGGWAFWDTFLLLYLVLYAFVFCFWLFFLW